MPCPTHPKYRAANPPASRCRRCRAMYRDAQAARELSEIARQPLTRRPAVDESRDGIETSSGAILRVMRARPRPWSMHDLATATGFEYRTIREACMRLQRAGVVVRGTGTVLTNGLTRRTTTVILSGRV